MHTANYLSYNKRNASVRVKLQSIRSSSPSFCFVIVKQCHIYIVLVQIYVVLVQCDICLKFLSSFPCSSKRFLDFRLSSTGLLINWFLMRKDVYMSALQDFLAIVVNFSTRKRCFKIPLFLRSEK